MVYSGFGGEQQNAQPTPPSGETSPLSAYPPAPDGSPTAPDGSPTAPDVSPAAPPVNPEPAERPFLLPDDVDEPAPFPDSFEAAFPAAHKNTTPPPFVNPYTPYLGGDGFPGSTGAPGMGDVSAGNMAGTGGIASMGAMGGMGGPTSALGVGMPGTTPPGGLNPLSPTSTAGAANNTVNNLQLLQQKKATPRSGWRKFIYKATGGAINPGPSSDEKELEALEERIRQPVRGDYRIACLSLKGGVGKTTTTIGLGSTFASLRGDRIIAIDANPDLGTLAQRVPQQTNSTVRDLLEDPSIRRYSDVRAHTSQARSRLEVLASESDPAISEAFSERDYRRTIDILQSFYNIILTDCGTGLMHDAMRGVLDLADSLVLVSSPAIDGARSAWATLNWLDAHGYQHLVERTVVAICSSRAGSASIDMDQLRATFNQRCAAVHLIPFDEHLAEGAEVDIDQMSKGACRAFIELAASVADGFSQTLVPSSVNRREKHHPEGPATTMHP